MIFMQNSLDQRIHTHKVVPICSQTLADFKKLKHRGRSSLTARDRRGEEGKGSLEK